MQLNIQPQYNFQPQITTGPQNLQELQPGSQYQGTPYANVGQQMQAAPQHVQLQVDNALRQAGAGGVVLGQNHLQGGLITEHQVHQTGAEAETAYTLQTPPMPADQTARLEVSTGFTKNLGDYQSYRVNVSVQLPWPVNDVQRGLDECQRIATERMQQMWARG